MGNYYLAVDLGASGGRLIRGFLQDGKLILEEIHRFVNGMNQVDGSWCWDYGHICSEILTGLKKCAGLDGRPVSLGIDTWGVDYVLTDRDGQALGRTYGYRDTRNQGMDKKVEEVISPEELYERTGILKASYNTIYQLMADKTFRNDVLERAENLLMVPDYLNYLLTGKASCEYTEASTTQLLKTGRPEWDMDLIRMLGYPEKIFLPIVMPGTKVGSVKEEIAQQIGFDLEVVSVASHDTASAIAAIPAEDREGDFLYISSGTWSMMGVMRDEPQSSEAARLANVTNEAGYAGKICFHKNIMGLWMIQCLRNELGSGMSFGEIAALAEEQENFPSRINVNDERYMAPDSVSEEIRKECRETSQKVPETIGELASVVYHSLADYYAQTAAQLEELTGKTYEEVLIVGGGSNASFLNRLTAEALNKKVTAGLQEATATGNLLVQMIASGELASYEEAKSVVRNSFSFRHYEG